MSIIAPIYKKLWYNGVIREQDDSHEYIAKHPRISHKLVKLKLDKIMRKLFTLSDQVTLQLINALFDQCFSANDVTIHYGNCDFINDAYDRITGDLYITVESEGTSFHYHIEFQTLNDETMKTRMFRYGFEKGVELAKSSRSKDQTVISFPQQLVIFLEKNEAIEDFLSFNLRLSERTAMDYIVPVMRYWTYSSDELVKSRMYALLPLQVFLFRKAMKAIANSSKADSEKSRLITDQFIQLEQTIKSFIEELVKLSNLDMNMQELDGILSALQNLTEYLYSHYGEYKTFKEKAHHMGKKWFDLSIMEKGLKEGMEAGKLAGMQAGKLEVASRLLHKGLKVNEVAEITDLPVEEIQKLTTS